LLGVSDALGAADRGMPSSTIFHRIDALHEESASFREPP
jgi:hypothetical protein